MSEELVTRFVREGRFLAEVDVTIIDDGGIWSPYLMAADLKKLDAVRLALRSGETAEAAKFGRVFEVSAIAAAAE